MVARRFPIAVAQRLDIRLAIPRAPAAHPVLAVLEGERKQTGHHLACRQTRRSRASRILASTASPALTLDLESRLRAASPLKPRKADRVHTLNLTGDMANYIWSLNNVAWTKDVPPLPIAKGERVELIFVNQTPMPHPMHLHGHEFQVVEIDGKRFPGAVRDTVLVPPGRRVVVAFDANNPGLWALPLPPALPPRRRHVHDLAVRLTAQTVQTTPRLQRSIHSRRHCRGLTRQSMAFLKSPCGQRWTPRVKPGGDRWDVPSLESIQAEFAF